ncbi:MAG TPA: GAF domain-containing protein [Ferruginibacter sp.]|nr:GAF domain-containing protein [Ferruginibacter sp.]HRO06915.1 GAF domain-containing protein [Ferruginibacter sp.]HRO96922.1 GAF domain-containing protein [Ferruginibacter sp.]HRP50020.1 GAF domain-containing protein [Ferruginibacter sp.]
MSESLQTITGSRGEQYEGLIPQIAALIEGESNRVANMANVTAALKTQFNWLWVGFYLVEDNELVLGPFQGPIACTRIRYGKGVCGSAWEAGRTLIVDDVEKFPGHIACSSLSRSEIVVPVFHQGTVVGVLDVDSESLAHFTETDAQYLEEIVRLLFPG